MALVIKDEYVLEWLGGPPYLLKDKASRFHVSVPTRYLSEAYELKDGDEIEGEILEIGDVSELKGAKAKFILYTIILNDCLFFSKDFWEILREYGLVKGGFRISVRLEKAIKEGKEIPLYTKRDVEI